MADSQRAYTRLLKRLPPHAYRHGVPFGRLEDWSARHAMALANPAAGFERALVQLLNGWLEYAEAHEREYQTGVAGECVIGPAWEAIGDALRILLDGQTGSLDLGLIDKVVLDAMKDAGFEISEKLRDE